MKINEIHFKNIFYAQTGDNIENRVLNKNGEPLLTIPAYLLDEKIARQHSAYAEIEWELEDSKKSLLLATKYEAEDIIRSSLFVSSLMAYGRVFTQAEGRGGIKLEGDRDWLGSESLAVKRHKELMDFRHKIFAHTGDSPFRACQTSIVTSLLVSEYPQVSENSLPRNMSLGIGSFKLGVAGFGNEDIDNTIKHIECIITKVQNKIKILETRLTEIAIDRLLEK